MASVSKRSWIHNGERKTKWVVRYTDGGGKKRLKTFEQKKHADDHKREVENELAAGTHVAPRVALTVNEIYSRYIEQCKNRARDGRLSGSTLDVIERAFRLNILPAIGCKKYIDLVADDIDAIYQTMVRSTLHPRSAKDRLDKLRTMEGWAHKRGMIRRRTVSDYMRDLRGLPEFKLERFKHEDVLALLKAAETINFYRFRDRLRSRLKCTVHIAAFCGLRMGEILGLTREDIDLAGRTITVRHSLSAIDGLKAPKTAAGNRVVPIPAHLALMLEDWFRLGYYVANHANTQELVFTTRSGKPISQSAYRAREWHPLLKAAGLCDGGRRFRFHGLRAFAASWWISLGVSLSDVASLLGHRKFDVTLQAYAHSVIGGRHRHRLVDEAANALLAGPIVINAQDDKAATTVPRHPQAIEHYN